MPNRLKRLRYIWNHTRKGRVLAVLLVLFGLINGFVYLQYSDRTYARTAINGQTVGTVPINDLNGRIQELPLIPETIVLTYQGKSTTVTPKDIGLQVDSRQTAQALANSRSWLPLANLFMEHRAELFVSVEPKTFERAINVLGKDYRREAQNASLVLRGNKFVVTPETNAQTIDVSGSQARIVDALTAGRTQAELMMRQTPPAITRASLQSSFDNLEAQRAADVGLTFQGKTKTFTPEEIGGWFVPQAGSFTLDAAKVDSAVNDAGLELGVNVTNAATASGEVKAAVAAKKAARIKLDGRPLGKRTYSYCTAGRGVPQADVDGMSAIINSTLNAKRGWSLSNNISFVKSDTTCDFTIWLAAPDQMTSFGAICDAYWSCAVKPNVIFNWDRWRYTSEPWKKTGGSLDDYRVMVINHEVGHWLGFDHSNCPVQGQLAPVMQQQSIDLQGCVFNPWPTATERTALKNYLGL